jgi:HD-like signal output (HDOD) protein
LALFGFAVVLAAIALSWPRMRRPAGEQTDAQTVAVEAQADTDAPASAQPEAGPTAADTSESETEQQSPMLQETAAELMRRVYAIAFGKPVAGAGEGAIEEAEIAASIHRMLAGIADKPNYAPRRPLLLPKLMQAMHDDEVSRRELARIIGTDPALAGALLRLANSPFYRIRPEPVESLDRAIALLGLEGMRSLIAAALMQPVFRSSGGVFAKFGEVTWEHTLYSANAAEAHAAVLENSDPFAAQLLSLVMGLATMVLFRVATDEYLSRRRPPSTALIAGLLESETPTLARQIASSWQLSERIDSALAEQEQSPAAPTPRTALGRSLEAGRFLGALAVLHARNTLDEDDVKAALTCTPAAGAYERIWNRLRAMQMDR